MVRSVVLPLYGKCVCIMNCSHLGYFEGSLTFLVEKSARGSDEREEKRTGMPLSSCHEFFGVTTPFSIFGLRAFVALLPKGSRSIWWKGGIGFRTQTPELSWSIPRLYPQLRGILIFPSEFRSRPRSITAMMSYCWREPREMLSSSTWL